MKMQEAQNLQEKFGNNACDHMVLEKEYHLGAATGDYVCKQCRKSGWGSDWNTQNIQSKAVSAEGVRDII